MPRGSAPPGFVLVCLNVQGLTGPKLLSLLSWLKEQQVDAAVLTETRSSSSPEDLLHRLPGAGAIWPGARFFHTPGTGFSEGVCIVLGPSCGSCAPLLVPCPSGTGRLLRLDLTLAEVPVTLVGVYGPAQPPDRWSFFESVLGPALPADGRALLVGGDFNCVLSDMDCVFPPGAARPARSTRHVGAAALQAIMETAALSDVWRAAHGSACAHTHWSASAQSGARLDRWLVSSPLLASFQATSRIHASSGITTDHLPVFLRVQAVVAPFPRGRGLQGFPLQLLNMPGACAELRAHLSGTVDALLAGPDEGIVQRWDALKEAVRYQSWALYRKHRRIRQQEARDADSAAERARQRMLSAVDPVSFSSWAQAASVVSVAASQAWQRLASVGSEAAASLDQLFGDSSSYYFHQQARPLRTPHVVRRLNRPDRAADADPGTVDLSTLPGVGAGLGYCQQFFSADSPTGLFRARQDTCPWAQDALLRSLPRRLSVEAAALAEGPDENGLLAAEELELALQQSRRGSVPGVDGLPYEFYRAFRSILVPALLRVFNAAFQDTEAIAPLQPLLVGVLCLLLKAQLPSDELPSYRPLTLLNCDVKLLMLVLSNRLQRPLDYVIDIVQSAFLRGRDISDNVRYHLGLAARLQELGLPGWLLHSDLTKAYDTADRGWLLRCMQSMGFRPAGIIRWCSLLLSGTQAQVRLNGFLSAPFPLRGGLPQGGALSCDEWVILLEPCLSYLGQLRSCGRLRGLPLPDGSPAPAVCAFADDTKSFVQVPAEDGPALKGAFSLAARAGLPVQSVPKTKLIHLTGPVPAELDASVQPTHVATGYRLQPAGEPHRLLGVPFGSDEGRCQAAAFGSMASSVRAAAAVWAPQRLNLLGRSHVAMQCLASKFVYQANFRQPGPVEQAALQQAINRFVGTTSWEEEVAPYQGQLFPSYAVSSLPIDRGGLGLPHVESHGLAMQAKTAWLLFRHTSHPWAALFRHEVAMACTPRPGTPSGFHALVTAPDLVQAAAIRTPLARSAVQAFQRLRVCRVLSPAEQPPLSVLLELTFFSSPSPDHPALLPFAMASAPARQWWRLRDVRAAFLARASLPPDTQGDLDLVLAWLPLPWRNVVCSPALPPSDWQALPAPPGSCGPLFWGPDPLSGVEGLWELWPSGRLHAMPPGFARPLGPGRPACIRLRAKDRSAWTRADYTFHTVQQQRPAAERQPLVEPWVVGTWDELELDPSTWGLRLPHDEVVDLLELAVRHARHQFGHVHRMAQLHTSTGSILGYREERAAWPRTWPLAAGADAHATPALRGLAGLEERWRQSAMAVGPAVEPDPVDWAPPWLDLASQRPPRVHPMDRAQHRLDAVPAPPALRGGHRQAWERLADPTLHRPFRITCWKLMHGCLGCHAFLHHVRVQRGVVGDVPVLACSAPACQEQAHLETLTHAFLECPAVSPAIDWLLATWTQLSDHPVPRCARVLLLDDLDAWQGRPTDRHILQLWTRLRVSLLGAIWQVRCSRAAEPGTFARRAVCLALQHLLGAIQRDWARTQDDIRHQDAGGFCVDWWRGVDTLLPVSAFVDQWARPPLFCTVQHILPSQPGGDYEQRLELLLGPGFPVALPP